MKRVSAKMFFSVVWKGVCQALGWFFGLFGYKREGKFAKCVWGLFATSGAILLTIVAGALVYALYQHYELLLSAKPKLTKPNSLNIRSWAIFLYMVSPL